MVYICVAEKCKNNSGYPGRPATKKGLTFHLFPLKNPDICDIWTRNCGRGMAWKPSRHSRLCSDHFSTDCYEEDMYLKIMGKPRFGKARILKPGTLPTLFQHESAVQTHFECASRSPTERRLQPREEKQPDHPLLPSTYSVAPEFIANVNQNPIETTEDPELRGDQTKGQFTGNRDAPECQSREGKSAAETSIGRDVKATERLLQTIPGDVEARLEVKPDDHLATFQSKPGSILQGEGVENDRYNLDLVDDHQVKLRRLGEKTIKKEKPDTEYDRARAKNSHEYSELNSLEERSEVRSIASDFNPLQLQTDISNTGTQKHYDALIRHCRSLTDSLPNLTSRLDYRFVLPVRNQSHLNYTAGISENSDVVGSNAPVVNQSVNNPDVCHAAGLSQNVVDPCKSQVVNSDLSQTCTAGWLHRFLSACNLKVCKPGLSQATASGISHNVVEQCNTHILNPIVDEIHTDVLSENDVDPCKSFDRSVGNPQTGQNADIHLTQTTDLQKTFGGDINVATASTESALHRSILETENPGSETETASTLTASDVDYIDDDNESPPLFEHSILSEAERCRTENLYTKARLAGSDSLKKEFAEGQFTGLKTVPKPHVSRDVMTSESAFVGGVETHHDCYFCDFTTLGVDELFYHMSVTHGVNMETSDPQPLSPSIGSVSESESLGSSTMVVENRPNDLIEKETDNDMDVYKCRECCYTFRRESAALSHVKMKHLNKEVAILYENLKRADARSASKRVQARKRRDSDESFNLSECSESSHGEEIEDDGSDAKAGTVKDKAAELKSKTKSVNEEYVKTVEENGSVWFECTVCENRWPTMAALSKHISMTHSKKQRKTKKKSKSINAKYVRTVEEEGLVWFECTLCGDPWGTVKSVNKHISLMHNKKNKTDIKPKTVVENRPGDESFNLSECSESTESDNANIKSDKKPQKKDYNSKFAKTIDEGGTEWFECRLCGDRWATVDSLNFHLSSHKEKRTRKPRPKNSICDLCGESCSKLSDHKRMKHRSKSQQEADKEYGRNYARKKRLESGPMPCPKQGCDTIISSRRALPAHIRLVHGPKVKCDICGKLYSNKILLVRHNDAVHLRVRKYLCTWPDCGKVFLDNSHRRVHMRIHTNEKPLQCELCGFRARQSNSLRYHFTKHHKARSPSSDGKT